MSKWIRPSNASLLPLLFLLLIYMYIYIGILGLLPKYRRKLVNSFISSGKLDDGRWNVYIDGGRNKKKKEEKNGVLPGTLKKISVSMFFVCFFVKLLCFEWQQNDRFRVRRILYREGWSYLAKQCLYWSFRIEESCLQPWREFSHESVANIRFGSSFDHEFYYI